MMDTAPQNDAPGASAATRKRPFDLAGKRVVVAGHRGMAGSAMVRRLAQETCKVLVADRNECDLTRQEQTEGYFANNRPDAVIMAAGRVGGILANDHYPVNFLAENLAPRAPRGGRHQEFLCAGQSLVLWQHDGNVIATPLADQSHEAIA